MMEREAFEKLRWRCIRRGLLEVDLALTRFLDKGFDALSEEEQSLFAELADYEDHELWHLISGQSPCEDERMAPLVERIRGLDCPVT